MNFFQSIVIRIFQKIAPLIKSDTIFIKCWYFVWNGYFPNLKNPKTFNEKLNWLKLNYRNPLYTQLVDKSSVKNYVAERIGEEYIIPTLGLWNSFDEIDFDNLPDQFVLKCTHDSASYILCDDKSKFDIDSAREMLSHALSQNYYYQSREWPYKDVPPRIIAEKYMKDNTTKVLNDYKFFCFDGDVKFMFIATGRGIDTRFDFFDINFNHMDILNGHKMSDIPIEKPKNFELMIELSKILSKGMPHVRIDFYEINGRVYFGEFTFFHWGAVVPFDPISWDKKFGDYIDLNRVK